MPCGVHVSRGSAEPVQRREYVFARLFLNKAIFLDCSGATLRLMAVVMQQ